MRPFMIHEGIVAPLDRANVDTDQIIPKQFLRRNERQGFGEYLFHEWRHKHGTNDNAAFVLDEDRYRAASILLVRKNFGGGSSREHAVWALWQHGFRAILSPSFADIFHANALQNGLLPIVLPESMIDELFHTVRTTHGYALRIDVGRREVEMPRGERVAFPMNAADHRQWIEGGQDPIARTLRHRADIESFERRATPVETRSASTGE